MAKKMVTKILSLGRLELVPSDLKKGQYARLYRKFKDYTMIPETTFIRNLELVERYKALEGDFVECGVWKGGMSAACSVVLGKDRLVHLFDSFEGLPPVKAVDGKEAIAWQLNVESPNYFDNCSAEESFVKAAVRLAEHENYRIYKGWFQETLQNFKEHKIAILRLDGDWYDSIRVCLQYLFPKVLEGGIVILDDYYTWDGCAKAVHDYLTEVKSPSRIYQWNNEVAYIIKKI